MTLLASPVSVPASEFFDDVQRVVQPRLIIQRGQRIRLMIRKAVEGRLGPDGPGNRMNGVNIPGLGVISPSGADAAADPQWGAWVDGSYTYLDSDDFGAQFKGPQGAVGTGIDYALSDAVILGASFNYEHSNIRNSIGTFAPGRLKTDTFSVGPYLGVVLSEYLLFDASFVYSWGDNDITDQISRGDFDTQSWNASANLTAYLPLSNEITFAPTVGLSYSRNRDDAYTDNIGFSFPAQTIYTGVFNFGASLSYFIPLDDVRSIEPSISIEGAWEFDLFGKPPLGVGVASNSDDKKVDVTVTGGADITLSDMVSLSLSSSVGGLTRKQYIEISGGAQVSVQF